MSPTRITPVTVPAAVAILAAACATASAQTFNTTGSDIIPRVVSGQMTTGAKDDRDPTGTEVLNVRVYPYYFQSNPDDPYFDQDPGFNAPAGSGLGASSTLSYNVLSGLSYWDGTGPVTQTLPPANEAIQYKLGISSATVTGSSAAQPGFNLARVQANGAVHVHLNAFLLGPDGNADATDGVVATPGIYFVTLQAVDNGVASSQPLYIVYDNGLPSSVLDQARVYTRNSFAPLTNLTGHSNYPTDRGDFPSTWAADAGGTWGAAGSWNGPVPAAQADSAVFGQVITAPRTVTLASPQTVGHLAFDDSSAYTLAGATLTLGDGSAPSDVVVNSGSHTLAVPVNLASHTTFNVIPAGSTLTVQSAITSNAGVRVAKEGAGTVVVKQLTAASLDVVQGTFRLLATTPAAAPTQLGALTVRDGATFDLATGSAVVATTGASSASSVLAQVAAAYDAGRWDRPGITSSAAADPANNSLTAVGTIDNSAAHLTSFQGVPVGDASVLLKYTFYGDANLDGKLNGDDYALLDRGFARHLTGWLNGDFNYDGVVDQRDYLLIDRAYALTEGGSLAPGFLDEREAEFGAVYVDELVRSVPEPVGLLPGLVFVVLSRRRRSRGGRRNESIWRCLARRVGRLGRRAGVSPRPVFMSDFQHRSGKMNVRCAFVAAAALSALGSSLALADYDVAPSASGGRIMTNAYSDGTDDFVPNVRVFAYGFDIPFSTEDPGFHPQPFTSGLAGAAALKVQALGGISYWDGTGSPSFTSVPNGESLNLAYGSQNFTITGTAPAASISLGTTDADGEFDRHLQSTLTGPASSDPTPGLYMVPLQLTSDGLTSSDPFYVIYNTGDDDSLSDAAVSYVRDTFAPGSNLVPEPTSLSLAGLPVLLGLTRRRRRD